jgi:hypothetical protein
VHDIQRPVVLIQRREAEAIGGDDVVDDPPMRAPLGRRVDEPAGEHREHRIGERERTPRLVADGGEQLLEPELVPQRPHRCHRADHRCLADLELIEVDVAAFGVGLQRGDDPVELAALT